jgi:hypothetical protein
MTKIFILDTKNNNFIDFEDFLAGEEQQMLRDNQHSLGESAAAMMREQAAARANLTKDLEDVKKNLIKQILS